MPNSLDPTLYTDSGLTPTITAGGLTKDATIGMRGSANAGSRIEIYDGATLTSSSRPITTGLLNGTDWTAVTPALSDGIHVLTAKITDANGNYTLFTSPQFTVDTVVSRAQIDHANESYTTNVQAISMQGWGELGAIAYIYDGDALLGAATMRHFYDGYDNFSYSIASLAAGPHRLYARVVDRAGNVRDTASIYPTIDFNPAHASVDPHLMTDFGALASGGATRDNTVTITGTADAGSIINVIDTRTGLSLGNATVNGTSWSLTTQALVDGRHGVQILATSPLNYDTRIAGPEFVIDTAVSIYSLAGAGNSYSSRNGTFTASGYAESGSTVTIYDGPTPLGSALLTRGALYDSFTYTTPALAEGAHQLFARVVDALGNAADTGIVTFTVDTQAPVVTISNPWGLTFESVGGTSSQGTQLAYPRRNFDFAGTVSSDGDVMVFDGATLLGHAVKDAAGTRWTYAVSGLADGLHQIWAVAADAAGNVGNAHSRVFIVDTGVSAATITTKLAPYMQYVSNPLTGFKDLSQFHLAGEAEYGSYVEIFDNDDRVSAFTAVPPPRQPRDIPIKEMGQQIEGYEQPAIKWDLTLDKLSPGRHELHVRVTDIAGNVAVSNSVTTISTTYFGDGGRDKLSGGSSDDVIVGNGGRDTLSGGGGNDLIVAKDLNFSKVDGGSGTDTLRLAGDQGNIDLSKIADRIVGIEVLDISDGVGNSLALDFASVVATLGAKVVAQAPGLFPPVLTVIANTDDSISLNTAGANWNRVNPPRDLGDTAISLHAVGKLGVINDADFILNIIGSPQMLTS